MKEPIVIHWHAMGFDTLHSILLLFANSSDESGCWKCTVYSPAVLEKPGCWLLPFSLPLGEATVCF